MKRRNKGYSRKKQIEVEEKISDLIGENYSDFEIEKALDLQPHIVRYYKNRIQQKAKDYFESLTPEMVRTVGLSEAIDRRV